MDRRIKDLVDYTRDTYSLTRYDLHQWDIRRSMTIFNETVYTLNMVWFPNHIKNWNEECNPDGTAYIEIDIHSKKLKSIMLVKEISYIDSIKFNLHNRDEIINWIEKETGLNDGKQFEFWKEEDRTLYFKGCIDGLAVSPSGYIELKLDEEGRPTFFSVIGQFPSKKLVKQETYALSLDKIEEWAKKQLKLIEFPVIHEKKLVPAFAIEEVYIKNDGSSTLPYEFFANENVRFPIDKVIEWDHPNQSTFCRKEVSFVKHVTPEQAFRCEPHPDLQPITEEEIQTCIRATQKFLSQEYANDSGKWVLKSLHRDHGYIYATLRTPEQKVRLFGRKMVLFIDSKTYDVLDYMDNESFLNDRYMEIKEAEQIEIAKEEAFAKLKDYIQLTPTYVYDFKQGCYVLCGKLDCDFAVKADHGEVQHIATFR